MNNNLNEVCNKDSVRSDIKNLFGQLVSCSDNRTCTDKPYTNSDTLSIVLHNTPDDKYLNPDCQQTELLKTVLEFLNRISTQLNSKEAKDLANQLSDKFCIG